MDHVFIEVTTLMADIMTSIMIEIIKLDCCYYVVRSLVASLSDGGFDGINMILVESNMSITTLGRMSYGFKSNLVILKVIILFPACL